MVIQLSFRHILVTKTWKRSKLFQFLSLFQKQNHFEGGDITCSWTARQYNLNRSIVTTFDLNQALLGPPIHNDYRLSLFAWSCRLLGSLLSTRLQAWLPVEVSHLGQIISDGSTALSTLRSLSALLSKILPQGLLPFTPQSPNQRQISPVIASFKCWSMQHFQTRLSDFTIVP